jgi:hypothetical protein
MGEGLERPGITLLMGLQSPDTTCPQGATQVYTVLKVQSPQPTSCQGDRVDIPNEGVLDRQNGSKDMRRKRMKSQWGRRELKEQNRETPQRGLVTIPSLQSQSYCFDLRAWGYQLTQSSWESLAWILLLMLRTSCSEMIQPLATD